MQEPELKKVLGLPSAVAIIVGGVIGSGIFMKPWKLALSLPDAGWIYAVWALVGVACLFGAFAYGELGCLLPQAGGQYSFIREAWGRFTGFLYGWTLFWVINTGTVAALAVAFASNLLPMFHLEPGSSQEDTVKLALAVGMILALALINHFGVRWGALFQNLSTIGKVGALAALVLVGVFMSKGEAPPAGAVVPPAPGLSMSALAAACIAVFWAYEGWHMLSFNAAEMRDPHRDLPRAFVLGTVILIGIYLAVNWVYMQVVGLDAMRAMTSEDQVPRAAVANVFGRGVAGAFDAMLAFSIAGAANSCFLSAPRAFFEMAKDGLMPRALMKVHPRWQTPSISIAVQALWSIVIVVGLRTFDDITVYVIFAALIFYALAVGGVLVLRRKLPDAPRAYRCTGFPITPLVFVAIVAFVDVKTLLDPEERTNALYGLMILATGVPAFLIARKLQRGATRGS